MLSALDKKEKKLLREKLTRLGYTSSPNASIATLRAKLAKIEGQSEVVDEQEELAIVPTVKSIAQIRAEKQKEDLKLIRVKISMTNPMKRGIPGEFITVANEAIGKRTKYIPYNTPDLPYHVYNCIYKALLDKKYLHIYTVTDPVTRKIITKKQWEPEFNVQVIPQLTMDELKALAAKQQSMNIYSD